MRRLASGNPAGKEDLVGNISPRVLVVGYNAFDVTVPFSGRFFPDTKNEVSEIRIGGGGPGATAAVAMARLGAKVRLVTPLADDLPGQLQREELVAAGVDVGLCPRLVGQETAKAVILVDPAREYRTIFWARGGLPLLDPVLADPAWLDETDLFYIDGHEYPAALALAPAAREQGLPVVLDAGSVREGSRELVAICTDVVSSEIFAPVLTGKENPAEALAALAALGPDRVAMTFGGGGMLALVAGRPLAIPAFDLPVVDTTGAGDAFHAGYAFGLGTGRDFPACLRLGAAVAGLKCGAWGGRSGLPDLAAAEQVLAGAGVRPLDPRIAGFAE